MHRALEDDSVIWLPGSLTAPTGRAPCVGETSVTISRGPSENPVHGAEDRAGGCCCFLRRCGSDAFHQAGSLFKDHAAVHPVARGVGADQRSFRDPRWAWAARAINAAGGGVGTGGAAARGIPCQYLYGPASGRGRRRLDCAGAVVVAASVAGIPDLVGAVVYAAEPAVIERILELHFAAAVDLWPMERKIFWLTFMLLGLVADFVLPVWWALGATIPIFFVSWWVAYRSDWF